VGEPKVLALDRGLDRLFIYQASKARIY